MFYLCLQTHNTSGERRVRWINRELVNIHRLSLPLKVIVQRKLWVISQTPAKTIAGVCEARENKSLLRCDLCKVAVFDGSATEKVAIYKDVPHWRGDNQKSSTAPKPGRSAPVGWMESMQLFLRVMFLWCLLIERWMSCCYINILASILDEMSGGSLTQELISQWRGSNPVRWGMLMCWRRLVEVHKLTADQLGFPRQEYIWGRL